jgi:DNA-binding NarL/FixJ family response regulator
MSIRILLADDHKIMRDGLRTLLAQQADMEVVAEADNGRTAVALARELEPDVIIMDIGMPEMNGIEAARQIRRHQPAARVIALSMHSDRRFVAGMLGAEASGYLLKDCAFEELAHAIHTVMSGQVYVSPGIAKTVLEDYARALAGREAAEGPPLSPREREVLQLLAEGKSTKQIARALSLSVKTVETHRAQVMSKLGLHSVAELTKYAIREGLTSLEH